MYTNQELHQSLHNSNIGLILLHNRDSRKKTKRFAIPKDVPRGHLAVHVGDDYKRFVIKLSLLKHPIFKASLDQAQDGYDFSSDSSRLWIRCDKNTFLDVVSCSGAPQHQRNCIGMYL
ncbi:unnamed protein product [Eruca vesicaria subsp. sativa]|uniref:Uncharacterized protein n=1 Tax=Eruca vesicaria subsp. sativa TaxID=29727 RepID=A0ABC8JHJ8_ERUVS|nr:unnamed protein product [Eruca vesicaria subsp. sativa]